MDYIYEDLRETEYIDDAYERWEEYRRSLTGYVLGCLDKPSRLAIIGAGACNDYDLSLLISKGHEITLIDYNKGAMQMGLNRQHIGQEVTMIELDVFPVGISGYHGLEELFQRNAPFVDVRDYLDRVTGQALQSSFKLPGQYDIVLAAGFHSQLSIALVTLLHEYQRLGMVCFSWEEMVSYAAYVSGINTKLAKQLHEKLCIAASRFLYGCEYACFAKNDASIYQIKSLFEQGRADVVKELCLSRVEGAYQLEQLLGREIMDERLMLESVSYFIWPFHKEKQYLLAGYVCRKCAGISDERME